MEFASAMLVVTKGLKYPKRRLSKVSHLVIHRCDVGLSAHDAHLAYRDTRKYEAGWYTGGRFPYHYLIGKDGLVEQCLPTSFIGYAAKGLNECGIHIALIGDFRKHAPTAEQVEALQELCRRLQLGFGRKLKVRGHTEEPGASVDPNKECPGRYLDVAELRQRLAEWHIRK